MRIKNLALALCSLVAALAGYAGGGGHNTFKCDTCHFASTPGASGNGPKWNPEHTADGLPTFKLYSSPSFDRLRTDIGQPDGPSKLCLGCHDGSYPGISNGSKAAFSAADLSRSHPISFTYNSSLAARVPERTLHDPSITASGLGGTIKQDMLDENGKLQCTSCHNMHAGGYGPNHLIKSNSRSRLCLTCHDM